MAFVRRKRVDPYKYYQLVENRWMDEKQRQKVFLHLGNYTTVEAALGGWPKEVEGLRRFAIQRWDKADRLKKDAAEPMAATILKRVRKAEKLADEIALKLQKLHNLKAQGNM